MNGKIVYLDTKIVHHQCICNVDGRFLCFIGLLFYSFVANCCTFAQEIQISIIMLKQLLIILMLFGTGSSIYSLVNAGIMLTCTFLNMLFRRFWNKEKTVIFGILFTGFLSSLILELGQAINYKWATDNKLFIYSLAIIPIVLLEYSEYNFKVLIRELMLYIDSFIFVGFLKELMVNGSLLGLTILKDYEGLLIFNSNSGTLLLIGLTMVISEFLKERRK